MHRVAFIVGCALFGVAFAGAFGAACLSSDDNTPSPTQDGSAPAGDGAVLPNGDASGSVDVDATTDSASANGDSGEGVNDGGAIVDSAPPVDATPMEIASNLGASLYSLTASNGNLFWISQGDKTIARCSAAACAATVTTMFTDSFSLQAIAVDSTNLYFTEQGGGNGGALYSIPIDADGGVAQTHLLSGLSAPLGIAVDATGLYFTQSTNPLTVNDGIVSMCDPAACASTLVAISGQPFADSVALSATTVYWTGQGSPSTKGFVRAVPKGFAAGNVVTLGYPESSAALLAIDSTNVYFVAYQGAVDTAYVWFCPLGGCDADAGAAMLSTTATALSNFGPRVASDGVHVYFLGGNGNAVNECPVTGCNGAAASHGTFASAVVPSSIALGADAIYVAASGSIYQIAK